jgi:hypothetical protein
MLFVFATILCVCVYVCVRVLCVGGLCVRPTQFSFLE